MKKAIRVLNGAAKGDDMEDEEDEDEEDEEEEEEEEEEEIEEEETHEEVAGEKEYGYSHGRPASARSGSTDMQAFERGAMVRIVRTSDVDQRVPHTVGKIGLIEDVPQHPNTWFKVRIRDGDVVYKYRPSALLLVNSDDVDMTYDDEYEEEPEPRPTKLRSNSTSSYNGGSRRSRDDGGDDTDGIDDSEGEQKEQDDDDEEMDEMEIDTRVRVQLGTLSRRERDLKKYQGKLGVIIAVRLKTGHGRMDIFSSVCLT
jgi:ribosomal protein L21E